MKKTTALFLSILLVLTYLSFIDQDHVVSSNTDISKISIPMIQEKSQGVTEYAYRSESKGKQNLPIAFEHKVWVKDHQARIEVRASNPQSPSDTLGMLVDEDSGQVIMYNIKSPRQQGSASSTIAVGRLEDIRKQTFLSVIDNLQPDETKILGLERIFNRQCLVLQHKDKKIFIDPQNFVPVREEDKRMITDYLDVRVGPGSVEAKELEMPDNATLVSEAQEPPPKIPDFPNVSAPYSKYKALTKEQLDDYLNDKKITPLAVRNIGLLTIVLCETDTERVTYCLTANPDGKIEESQGASSNNSDIVPVSIKSGGGYSQDIGTYSYIAVIFNDVHIQNEAATIEIIQLGKVIITEALNKQKGVIIPGQLKIMGEDKTNVIIRSQDGKELYNSEESIKKPME